MKKLGTLVLPQPAKWTDEYEYYPIRGVTETSVGGYLIPFQQRLIGGRPVTIECDVEHGYFTTEQVATIIDMASQIGATYLLYWGQATYPVMFSRESQKPYEFQPLEGYFDDTGSQLYTGKINLITIN